MRKIIVASATLLFLIILGYSAYFYLNIAKTEYVLHQVNEALVLAKNEHQLLSRKQKIKQLNQSLGSLESTTVTPVNIARTYQAKSQVLQALSELEVWPNKRRAYLEQALYHNYNTINVSHYNLQYWLLGLQLQQQLQQPLQQRRGRAKNDQHSLFWTLANVLMLSKWNQEALSYGVYYCVLHWKALPESLRERCSTALSIVETDSVQQRKMMDSLRGIYRSQEIVEEMQR